jgi:hypothetical protein
MQLRQFKPRSESEMASLGLTITFAGVNTLIGIGIIILLIM